MILRFRSKQGMARVNTEATSLFLDALREAYSKLNISGTNIYVSDVASEKGRPELQFEGVKVSDIGLQNGDMLFITFEENPVAAEPVARSVNGSVAIESIDIPITSSKLPQLEVDNELEKADGQIHRTKTAFCKHGDKGMCDQCSPLPPWDKDYLAEHGIKHKSFHAYAKEMDRLKNNAANGSSYIAPLSEPDYAIKKNCAGGHAAYPKGICSKCQPAPITLQQQKFRMVDNLEYADFNILNKFIDTWRKSGTQRYGVLYGRYERYDKAPLGIKAVVEAIYEPPQSGELDGITLLEWKDEEIVDKVAQSLGLCQVGMVFTDLTDAKASNGTVLCKRHKDTFFLSCAEVIMAAKQQNKHVNVSNYSDSGKFSSKFVTCVVTGGLQGEIEPRAYQVSTSAEALVKADDINASTHPNMIMVKETNSKRYVPDVFYSKINEYGLEVKENAKPAFPTDFLLVSLSDSFPLEPNPKFALQFPIENRDFLGELQDLRAVRNQLQNGSGNADNLSDFHLLVYLAKMNILSGQEIDLLLRSVRDKKLEDYLALVETGGWMTLLTVLHSV